MVGRLISMGQAILIVCSALMVADGLVTWWGTRSGLRELNPFLRQVLSKSGPMGLLATRAAALGLLLLLFNLLSTGIWIIFSSTFAIILGLIVSNDLRSCVCSKRRAKTDSATVPLETTMTTVSSGLWRRSKPGCYDRGIDNSG